MGLFFWICSPLEATASQTHPALLDFQTLASAEMQGRVNGSHGSILAQQFLVKRYAEIGIQAFAQYPDFRHTFELRRTFSPARGVNIIGYIPATKRSAEENQSFIVITAHYDHLGMKGNRIFYGADDNASGVAGLLALAKFANERDLYHSVILLATDAEEKGLYGAKAALANFPVPLEQVAFNYNLDMISQVGSPPQIHLSGVRSSPAFNSILKEVREAQQTGIVRLMGEHRAPRNGASRIQQNKYRRASDHAIFIDNDIPYLFLGVTEHQLYHTPKDTFDRVDTVLYLEVLEIAKSILVIADQSMHNRATTFSSPPENTSK